ncbi:uncharacterized protein LOC124162590 isoform X2 [Ischnura elegans]|uniref:uncharacterized protein LOC124162590 isoform X2 n=1 Tax=Ischnura elegans TaxID=197161 RepID=UPI001ED8882C|nr:uncharacterized protein LOC124162590 isoform X2 [Ischnura elegans]
MHQEEKEWKRRDLASFSPINCKIKLRDESSLFSFPKNRIRFPTLLNYDWSMMHLRQGLTAFVILWPVVAAVEHALFVRVARQEPLGIFGEEGYNIPVPSGPPLQEEPARDISETLGDPSRQYLPALPGSSTPRPFQPGGSGGSSSGPSSSRPGGGGSPFPSRPPPPFPPSSTPSRPSSSGGSSGGGGGGGSSSGGGGSSGGGSNLSPSHSDGDDSHLHPPHIHALDVTCAKDQMDIRIEFDREFDGTIYSKGFYTDSNCRHVSAGSGQIVYQFSLYLNQCGTRFVDAFATNEGRAYLESTLVLQNEPGIQEVWDTVRNVQCLWEGNIRQQLKTGVSVDGLDEQVVTFSGDTASAQLDVRVGKFGEGSGASATAGGLVQIGTDMSLVVTIDGDPGFDVHVRECIAKPAGGVNEGFPTTSESDFLRLTDERGCPLKTKIFGAFQKKRGGVGIGGQESTLYAFAHFQAFKFPDRNDVTIECDVELCKSGCDFCPNIDQNTVGFSVRSKREANVTRKGDNLQQDAIESVRMARHMRVVTPEELSLMSGSSTLFDEGLPLPAESAICMSHWGFATASILLLSALLAACVLSIVLYVKSWKQPPHILKAQALPYIPGIVSHR